MDERPRRSPATPLAPPGASGARGGGRPEAVPVTAPRFAASAEVHHLVAPGPGRRARLAALVAFAPALAAVGFDLVGSERLANSDLVGRKPLGALDATLDGRPRRLLVRSLEHGGLLRWATGRRFLDRGRPFRELELATALLATGFPTATVVAARARPAPLVGWWLDLVSERLEGTLDLGTWLEALRAGDVGEPERRAVFRGLGTLLARAHALGLAHADLQPRNVLLRRGPEPELFLIDLDRSRLDAVLSPERRARNLARLLRSTQRRERRGRHFLRRSDGARVLRAYCAELAARPGRAQDIRRFRSEGRAALRALTRGVWMHRFGWWLERTAGAKVEARDGAAQVRG
ncbi:MAG: hypothetical protein GC161_11065 [Planctomycetaceae bacterium]|nr:hypothetical protein [Planctomycetaceae bacterium]